MVVLKVIWLCGPTKEVRFGVQHPTLLYCDNKETIQVAKSPMFHERTKHIELF